MFESCASDAKRSLRWQVASANSLTRCHRGEGVPLPRILRIKDVDCKPTWPAQHDRMSSTESWHPFFFLWHLLTLPLLPDSVLFSWVIIAKRRCTAAEVPVLACVFSGRGSWQRGEFEFYADRQVQKKRIHASTHAYANMLSVHVVWMEPFLQLCRFSTFLVLSP